MSQKLLKAYPYLSSGNGPFTDLQNYDVPWKELDIATLLDIYYFNHSGCKLVSPVIYDYCYDYSENTFNALDATHRAIVANVMYIMFNHKWTKLYSILSMQYNPISNYDMVETEGSTTNAARVGTNTGTLTHTGTDTVTHTGTVGTSGSGSSDNSVFGFNSSVAVNSDSNDVSSTNTVTNNLTDTDTQNLTETRNLSDRVESSEGVQRELTRRGNIGVTTSQQMIESEIELWQWNFFDTVCHDIDSFLCLAIY